MTPLYCYCYSELGGPEDLAFWQRVMEEQGFDEKALLAAWVMDHFGDPFPTPEEKSMLSTVTGMPRTQVGRTELAAVIYRIFCSHGAICAKWVASGKSCRPFC